MSLLEKHAIRLHIFFRAVLLACPGGVTLKDMYKVDQYVTCGKKGTTKNTNVIHVHVSQEGIVSKFHITGGLPSERASIVENVLMLCRDHSCFTCLSLVDAVG